MKRTTVTHEAVDVSPTRLGNVTGGSEFGDVVRVAGGLAVYGAGLVYGAARRRRQRNR